MYNLRHPHRIHDHWYQNWSKLIIWICSSYEYLTIVTFKVKDVWTSSGLWNYRNMLVIHGTETIWKVVFHFKAFGNSFPVSFTCWKLQNICMLVYCILVQTNFGLIVITYYSSFIMFRNVVQGKVQILPWTEKYVLKYWIVLQTPPNSGIHSPVIYWEPWICLNQKIEVALKDVLGETTFLGTSNIDADRVFIVIMPHM